MKDYIEQSGGVTKLKPDVQDKFFDGLHASIQEKVFGGGSLLHKEVDGKNVEVYLPPIEQFVECIQLHISGNFFNVIAELPALVFSESDYEETKYIQQFQYTPPSVPE